MKSIRIALTLLFLPLISIQMVSGQENRAFRTPDYAAMFAVAPSYEYEYTEQMIEGGDGFKLLTRIYLPKGEGPWPVAVTRTPYIFGGRGDNNSLAREYAKRGIGYIQQDCRGKEAPKVFIVPIYMNGPMASPFINGLIVRTGVHQ